MSYVDTEILCQLAPSFRNKGQRCTFTGISRSYGMASVTVLLCVVHDGGVVAHGIGELDVDPSDFAEDQRRLSGGAE
jgi:hypothetical protein